jgi:hypothetical protein
VLGFLAIQNDQLLFGRRAAHFLLDSQEDFLHLAGIDVEAAGKRSAVSERDTCPGGYAGCQGPGVTPGSRARANLAMSFCRRGPPKRVAKKGSLALTTAFGLEAPAKVWHGLEAFEHRTNILHRVLAGWRDLLFDHRQRWLEMFGLETTAGVLRSGWQKRRLGWSCLT